MGPSGLNDGGQFRSRKSNAYAQPSEEDELVLSICQSLAHFQLGGN